jgi:hypothetical protein
MENIRYRHDTLVGGYNFFFPRACIFFVGKIKKNIFVGSGVKIRVGRVTGNQQLFFLDLMRDHHLLHTIDRRIIDASYLSHLSHSVLLVTVK